MPTDTDRTELVRVRRAPKYGVFLGLGAALGVLAAMVLTFAFDGTAQPTPAGIQYSQLQVFGFLALIGAAAGLLVGGVVALILDGAFGRRRRDLAAEHEHRAE